MGKHSDRKSKYKNQTRKDWERLKKFGITGIIRLILSFFGGVFLSALIINSITNAFYKSEGFILYTSVFLWNEIGYIIIWIQAYVIIFLLLSLLEQGIRKIFKSKNSENFAKNSFSILMELDSDDYEEVSAEDYIQNQISDKSHEKTLEEKLSGKSKTRKMIKGIALIIGIFIVINGFNIYMMNAGRTVVYNDRIIKTSFFNPFGKTYTYDDIREYFVEIDDDYPQLKIITKDNKKLKFNTGGDSIEEFSDDINSGESALVEIDKILKKHNVKKTINCEYKDFDDLYTNTKEIKPLFD